MESAHIELGAREHVVIPNEGGDYKLYEYRLLAEFEHDWVFPADEPVERQVISVSINRYVGRYGRNDKYHGPVDDEYVEIVFELPQGAGHVKTILDRLSKCEAEHPWVRKLMDLL